MSAAEGYLKDTENYSAADIETLQGLYDQASKVYKDANASQEYVDAQVRILNHYAANMKKLDAIEIPVVKEGLHAILLTASNTAGRESIYTKESLETLKGVIEKADRVYNDKKATQAEVNEQVSNLYYAILALEAKSATQIRVETVTAIVMEIMAAVRAVIKAASRR